MEIKLKREKAKENNRTKQQNVCFGFLQLEEMKKKEKNLLK